MRAESEREMSRAARSRSSVRDAMKTSKASKATTRRQLVVYVVASCSKIHFPTVTLFWITNQ